ncbi:MAG: dihydropteroate synthase [Oligoflexales bacterium]|nr:dihydropteroate synthase [Oligoflexales bacterium]
MITPSSTLSRSARIMGIVNVTPDSFSDGGTYLNPSQALSHIDKLLEDGAHIIDLGAESTRPGASPLPEHEEWARLSPILKALGSRSLYGTRLSLDTYKPGLISKAWDWGVSMINNTKGLCSDQILTKLAEPSRDMHYLAMHMWQEPSSMQEKALHRDEALEQVHSFFHHSFNKLLALGFTKDRVFLDPGIGFGKTDSANFALMGAIPRWSQDFSLAVGISRKSFLNRLFSIPSPKERDAPSKMLEFGLILAGASIVRTHDVKKLNEIMKLTGPLNS